MHPALETTRDSLRGSNIFSLPKYKKRENPPQKEPGYLLPFLIQMDDMLWGRWSWWLDARAQGQIPSGKIPQITFEGEGSKGYALKMLENVFRCLQEKGMSKYEAIRYTIDWILYGFGYLKEKPHCSALMQADLVFDMVDQVFQLGALQIWPCDYWGYVMSETRFGEGTAFFPTPHAIVDLMAKMTFHDAHKDFAEGGKDPRLFSMCDPCAGTGRMLMYASNYCLRLSGMDISEPIIRACLVNMYLYCPWAVAVPLKDHETGSTSAFTFPSTGSNFATEKEISVEDIDDILDGYSLEV